MENQYELADKLFRIACSESFWKHLHEKEMELVKSYEKKNRKKRSQ